METQLTDKHAVIFGAGGAVGAAVAREFAAQGATVFLSGRALDAVEQVAIGIHQEGGVAYAAQVDALDEPITSLPSSRLSYPLRAETAIRLIHSFGPASRPHLPGQLSLPHHKRSA